MIGFVGLGSMGAHMSRRLVAAGHELAVYDTRSEAVEALAAQGALACDSVRDVANRAEVVLVSLPTPEIVGAVAEELAGGSSIKTFLDLSTTGPKVAQEVAELLRKHGIDVVDAPVSGGPPGAEAGTLTVMVAAASEEIVARVRPLLEVIGSKLFVVGTEPGQGQMTKLINNLLSGAAIVLSGEAVVLGVKAGLDPHTLLEVVSVSSGSNTAVRDKFPKVVLPRTFDFGFRAELMAKDVHLCLGEAERLGVPMPAGAVIDDLWARAVAELEPGADCTAIVQLTERDAATTISAEAHE